MPRMCDKLANDPVVHSWYIPVAVTIICVSCVAGIVAVANIGSMLNVW